MKDETTEPLFSFFLLLSYKAFEVGMGGEMIDYDNLRQQLKVLALNN